MPVAAPSAEGRETRGWILFDDSCGFCRKWVRRCDGVLARRGFMSAPLQDDWVRERLKAATERELLEDMRLLLPDGSLLLGADAYRHVMRRIWWTTPIWLLGSLPLLRRVFDRAYLSFARHRYEISQACKLPGADESGETSRTP